VTHVNDVFLRVLIEVQRLAHHVRSERGQDTLEWAMLGGLVAISILGVVALLSGALAALITGVGNCIDFDGTTTCLPGGIF
jgi:Flp pilus assembly pilin Flp